MASIYDQKSSTHNVRKRCEKCKRYSWSSKELRTCWRDVEVVRGLNKPMRCYCGGTLNVVKRKKAARPASDLSAVANRKRRAALQQKRRAERRVKALKTRIKRLHTALTKQQRRVAHYDRLSKRSDAEIAEAQERIKIAQQVQVATRRLLKAAGVEVKRG